MFFAKPRYFSLSILAVQRACVRACMRVCVCVCVSIQSVSKLQTIAGDQSALLGRPFLRGRVYFHTEFHAPAAEPNRGSLLSLLLGQAFLGGRGPAGPAPHRRSHRSRRSLPSPPRFPQSLAGPQLPALARLRRTRSRAPGGPSGAVRNLSKAARRGSERRVRPFPARRTSESSAVTCRKWLPAGRGSGGAGAAWKAGGRRRERLWGTRVSHRRWQRRRLVPELEAGRTPGGGGPEAARGRDPGAGPRWALAAGAPGLPGLAVLWPCEGPRARGRLLPSAEGACSLE